MPANLRNDNAEKQYPQGIGGRKGYVINNQVGRVAWSVAAESSNAIAVTAQLKRLNGFDNLDGPSVATFWLFEDTSYTLSSYLIAATGAARYTLSVTTGTAIDDSENIRIEVISDADGTFIITVTDASAAGTDSLYLGIQIGEYFSISPVITFA
jgi:hypothetical protein